VLKLSSGFFNNIYMNEFLNVLEVDKLPLNKMDRFVGVDQDGNIKSASIVVDTELNEESDNAIANKTVVESLEAYKEDLEETVEELKDEVDEKLKTVSVENILEAVNEVLQDTINKINEDTVVVRQEITAELQSTIDSLNEINEELHQTLIEEGQETYRTLLITNDYMRSEIASDLEEMQNSVDSAVE
jgi:hypothetical protein